MNSLEKTLYWNNKGLYIYDAHENCLIFKIPLKKPLISWKLNPRKNPYISGNGTFLYFKKGIFRSLAYLELEAYSEA